MFTFLSTLLPTRPKPATPRAPLHQARPQAVDPAQLRAPEREIALSSFAAAWKEKLPAAIRPQQLCAQYPRVANRLGLCWSDPQLTGRLLEELLIDQRGGRRGFPKPVAEELMRLRRYHDVYHAGADQSKVWDFRTLAPSDR
jgi:hypothetical protein